MSPAPDYASRAATPAETSPQPPTYFTPHSKPTKSDTTPQEHEDGRDRSHSVNSVASLGSFPTPPTHFPLPPVANAASGNIHQPNFQSSSSYTSTVHLQSQGSSVPSESAEVPAKAAPVNVRKDSATFFDFSSPPASPSVPVHDNSAGAGPSNSTSTSKDGVLDPSHGKGKATAAVIEKTYPAQDLSSRSSSEVRTSKTYPVGDYTIDTEPGTQRIPSGKVKPAHPASASNNIERSDTNRSNGSIVAAMRDKYSRSVRVILSDNDSFHLRFCRPAQS